MWTGATELHRLRRRAASCKPPTAPRVPRRRVLDESRERQAAGRRMLGFGIAARSEILLLLQAAFGELALRVSYSSSAPCLPWSAEWLPRSSPAARSRSARSSDSSRYSASPRATASCSSIASSTPEREEGEAVGPELILAGNRRPADSDRDVCRSDRAGASAVGGSRRHSWERDHPPDGSRNPGRPHHIDSVQPRSRACSLLAFRAEDETQAVPACSWTTSCREVTWKVGEKMVGAGRWRRVRWRRYLIRVLSMVLIALGLVVVIQELSEKELSEDAVASESEACHA